MPKPATSPALYDYAFQFSVSDLRRWGYLAPGQVKNGVLRWSLHGETTAKISVSVSTLDEVPYIELNYRCNGEQRRYKVYFVSVPSNLNRGRVWYFLCPKTGKRCRKLFCIGGYFLHREAFAGCMYECQTQTKRYRVWNFLIGPYFESDLVFEQMHRKNFKRTYAGKPTKKYLQLSKKIRRADAIPGELAENAFLYV